MNERVCRVLHSIRQRLLYGLSRIIGGFIPVKQNIVFCWSFFGKNFSCNPAYFTNYLLDNHPDEYEIVWLFDNATALPACLPNVTVVRYASWRHLIMINKAGTVISNSRVENLWALWKKKHGQKYIMTYHASMGVKKVELDADQQYDSYIRMAKEDSNRCDLMLSGSRYWTGVMKRSFQYHGEILEAGTPRNDIMFHPELWQAIRQNLNNLYKIPDDVKLVLYAPTFRNNGGFEYYQLNWPLILNRLERRFGGHFCVLFRLHPDMLKNNIDASSLLGDDFLSRDLTFYHDIQELLAISDVLVTDYSSSMFDFALRQQPIFIYAEDIKTYNRGTYISLDSLPFPVATSSEELALRIDSFDVDRYRLSVMGMMSDLVCTYEKGIASQALYYWLHTHTFSG